jgi:hypothetical protein
VLLLVSYNKTHLMDRIRLEMEKQKHKFYMGLHHIICQQSLHEKTFKFEHVMRGVHFIQSYDFIVTSFSFFLGGELMLNMGMF